MRPRSDYVRFSGGLTVSSSNYPRDAPAFCPVDNKLVREVYIPRYLTHAAERLCNAAGGYYAVGEEALAFLSYVAPFTARVGRTVLSELLCAGREALKAAVESDALPGAADHPVWSLRYRPRPL